MNGYGIDAEVEEGDDIAWDWEQCGGSQGSIFDGAQEWELEKIDWDFRMR